MNSHRLARVADLVDAEFTASNTVKLLGQLVANLQAAINGPTEATQRSVEDLRTKLTAALETAPSNDFSPGTREELNELVVNEAPVADLVGAGLLDRLNDALEHGYTSVKTLDEVKDIQADVMALHEATEQIRTGLESLGISADDLEPGESIVGMTIPRTEISGVNDLRKELHVFGLFVAQLSEAINGESEEPQVQTLRSSGFGIDLSANLDVVAAFAMAIQGIKVALDKLQRFRGLKKQMEELKVETKTVNAIEKQSEESMKKDLDALEIEIANEFKYNDQGRPKELRTAVRVSLNRIANRMERGFIFEARTEIPENADPSQLARAQTVGGLSSLRFDLIEGPPLLRLPEGDLEGKDATAEPAKVEKRRKTRKAASANDSTEKQKE